MESGDIRAAVQDAMREASQELVRDIAEAVARGVRDGLSSRGIRDGEPTQSMDQQVTAIRDTLNLFETLLEEIAQNTTPQSEGGL